MNIRLFFASFIIAVSIFSCSKNYKMELADPVKHGGEFWQGYFVGYNGTHIPMCLGIREDRPGESSIEGYLVSGSETHRTYIRQYKDSFEMKGGMHSMFLGKFEGDSLLSGVLEYGINEVSHRTKFYLRPSNRSRFETIENITDISATGTWLLNFETDSLPFTLRYDMRRMREIDLYQNNDTIIASGYVYGEGKQGLDGVMTEVGFKMASFHHSEPFLIEAAFVDENNFMATVTSVTDTYTVKGLRKNQLKEDAEFSTSVFTGLLLTIKAFFRL